MGIYNRTRSSWVFDAVRYRVRAFELAKHSCEVWCHYCNRAFGAIDCYMLPYSIFPYVGSRVIADTSALIVRNSFAVCWRRQRLSVPFIKKAILV